MSQLPSQRESEIKEVHQLLEQGRQTEASLALTNLMRSWRSVEPRWLIELARQDREDGEFESARKLLELLCESRELSTRDRIVCLNNLAWLAIRNSRQWLEWQQGSVLHLEANILDASENFLDRAEQAASCAEDRYQKELAETYHQRAVVKMFRAEPVRFEQPKVFEQLVGEAELNIGKAVAIRKSISGQECLDLARTHVVMGWVLRRQNKLSDALKAYQGALKIRETAFKGDHHADVAVLLCFIAELLEEWGEPSNAQRYHQRACNAFSNAAPSYLARVRKARCHLPLRRFCRADQSVA